MIDLHALVARIDVSRLTPPMKLRVETVGAQGRVDILIYVKDANAADDDGTIELYQQCDIPSKLLVDDDEQTVVAVIYDWCRRVLEHELEECFKLDGKCVHQPRHPL